MTVLWGARIDGDTYGRTGDAPWDLGTWATFETHADKEVSLVHFGQPWCQMAAKPFDSCWEGRSVPLCSMDPGSRTLKDIAAGTYDVEIHNYARIAKEYARPFLLRWLWEMNGHWYPYGREAAADPSVYVKAWRRFFGILKADGATNVTSVWCPNVVHPGSTPLRALYPGNAHVDWVGLDGYNWAGLKGSPWRTFGEVFAASYLELGHITGKPVAICEVACTEKGGSKAAWIQDMFARLPDYPRVKALSWFNWPNVEGGVRNDWPVESSAGAQAAFAEGVADARYLAAAVEPAAGSKVLP